MLEQNNADNRLAKAKNFAVNAHESINQKRKYSGEPYYVHCERVVKILSEVTTDEEILAAAWMHDILEDVAPINPDYSECKIRQIFGDRVCNMVVELTDTPLNYGNRVIRKARDRERLKAALDETKTIKLADLIDNLIDIQNNDPGFAIIFAKEAKLMLPNLSGGDAHLFSKLSEILFSSKTG